MSISNANKYLRYFNALFDWARSNQYIKDNPFQGIHIKQNKKQKEGRDCFTTDEIRGMLNELQANTLGTVKNQSQYWGALLAIYTGARMNEIAGLTVEDVKQHKDIWYLSVTDEGEGKSIKTDAARRLIPIHSRLIQLGFLDFVDHSRGYLKSQPLTNDMQTRLLYDFTYTDKGQWGRKLGYFFNTTFLKKLGLHEHNKKTLHSLRHSFVTYLGSSGVDAHIIQSIVGHEQNTVTHSTYTHYGLEHLEQFKEAVERLGY